MPLFYLIDVKWTSSGVMKFFRIRESSKPEEISSEIFSENEDAILHFSEAGRVSNPNLLLAQPLFII